MNARIVDKAARLVVEDRVTELPESVVARVRGDHDHHVVTLAGSRLAYEAHCTCPANAAGQLCSHVLAVLQHAGWPAPVPAGQLALDAEHCPECGLDVVHDGHLPDCPIADTFVAFGELLADPADHEVDCECSGCTDQWRPEDAGPAILEAERAAAAECKFCGRDCHGNCPPAVLERRRVDRLAAELGIDLQERDR